MAHPHLAWLIFREWFDEDKILKNFANAISRVFEEHPYPGEIFSAISRSKRCREGLINTREYISKNLLFKIIYNKHCKKNNGLPRFDLISDFMAIKIHFKIYFSPDPVNIAISYIKDPNKPKPSGSTAYYLCLEAKGRKPEEKRKIIDAAISLITDYGQTDGYAPYAIIELYNLIPKSKWNFLVKGFFCSKIMPLNVLDLLHKFPKEKTIQIGIKKIINSLIDQDPAYTPDILSVYLAFGNYKQDAIKKSLSWLTKDSNIPSNIYHPRAYMLIALLLEFCEEKKEIEEMAYQCLKVRLNHSNSWILLNKLIELSPNTEKALQITDKWLDLFPTHPDAIPLFESYYFMLRVVKKDHETIFNRIKIWLDAYPDTNLHSR